MDITFLKRKTVRFFTCEEGATSIEYALIASLIALTMIIGATQVGASLNDVYEALADALEVSGDGNGGNNGNGNGNGGNNGNGNGNGGNNGNGNGNGGNNGKKSS